MSILCLFASGHPHDGQYPPQTERRPERLVGGAGQLVECPSQYQPPWTPLEHEIAILRRRDTLHPDRSWVPTTVDFQAEATRQAGGGSAVGVGSYQAFISAISRASGLQRVLYFGHGSYDELRFGTNSALTLASAQALVTTDLSGFFQQSGEIDLYCCNTGYNPQFLNIIAQKWRVNVAGTASGVRWRVDYTGEIHQNPQVIYRGVYRSGTWRANPNDMSLPPLGAHASPSRQQSGTSAAPTRGPGGRR